MKKYSAVLCMVALAVACLVLHFWFGWQAFIEDAATHGEVATLDAYRIEWARDTFENLQSEFWQLAAQFLLLAGALELIGVRAYEKDQEQIKKKLDNLQSTLDWRCK
jgi:hypothetical protein